jgi:hypothetical protein
VGTTTSAIRVAFIEKLLPSGQGGFRDLGNHDDSDRAGLGERGQSRPQHNVISDLQRIGEVDDLSELLGMLLIKMPPRFLAWWRDVLELTNSIISSIGTAPHDGIQ